MSHDNAAKGTIMRDDRITESSGRSVAQLERRAQELAIIRGIEGGAYEAEDMQRARAELQGEHLPTQETGEGETPVGLNRDPSDPPADRGHEVENAAAPDEQSDPETLALEGVDAAERERMLAARREKKGDV